MSAIKIKAGEWVVVCDGRKALILENEGDAKFPNLRMRETHEHEDSKTSEQGTDRPGRVHESSGTARSAMEQTDWHTQAEEEFLRMIAGRLDQALGKSQMTSLILVAPPRALGVLRQVITPGLRAAISAEISKDYVKMPLHEIETHLTAHA